MKLLDKAATASEEDAFVFSDDLTVWHQKLQVVVEVFVDIVKNAGDCVSQLKALEQLQQDKAAPLGRTWPMHRFVTTAEQLVQHFEQELLVKEMVLRELCHRTTSVQVMLTSSVWSYPRHVSKETRFIVKCLTVECGLPDVELSGEIKE